MTTQSLASDGNHRIRLKRPQRPLKQHRYTATAFCIGTNERTHFRVASLDYREMSGNGEESSGVSFSQVLKEQAGYLARMQ